MNMPEREERIRVTIHREREIVRPVTFRTSLIGGNRFLKLIHLSFNLPEFFALSEICVGFRFETSGLEKIDRSRMKNNLSCGLIPRL